MNALLRGGLARFMQIRFVRDVLTMQAGTAVYTVATLLSSIAFARLLGVEGYGAYAVVTAFVGTVMVVTNIGQGPALLVFLAEEHGKKNLHGMAVVIRNALHIWMCNALLMLLLAWIAPLLTEMLYGSRNMGLLARVLFLYAVTDAGNSMTLIVLQALRRIRTKVILEQAANVTMLLLAVVLLLNGSGVEGIVLAQLITSIAFLSVSVLRIRSLIREKALPSIGDIRRVQTKETWQYLRQGIVFSVEKNIGNLFPQGLFFLLSLIAPAASVGIIRIAVQLSGVPRTFLLAPVGGLSTTVLAADRANGLTRLRMNAVRIMKHTLALQAALSLALAVAIPFAVILLYGADYDEAIPMSWWLLLLSLPASLCIVNSPLIRLFRRSHISIAQTLLSWAIITPTLVVVSRLTSPLIGFLAAYGIGQLLPLTMTAYTFFILLRPTQKENPRTR